MTVPLERALTVLNLYDLLANLIPGIAWLFALIILYPVDWFGIDPAAAPGAFVAAVIVFGFIGGHVLQYLGSELDVIQRNRKYDGKDLYTRTMEAVENGDDQSPIGEVTDVERSFYELAKKKFLLPEDFPNSSKLLLLVLSYLETTPATRASRFQARHTFYRSMWAGSILTLVASIPSLVGSYLDVLPVRYGGSLVIFLASIAVTYIFQKRKNKFERTFLRYVFLDFYQDQHSQ